MFTISSHDVNAKLAPSFSSFPSLFFIHQLKASAKRLRNGHKSIKLDNPLPTMIHDEIYQTQDSARSYTSFTRSNINVFDKEHLDRRYDFRKRAFWWQRLLNRENFSLPTQCFQGTVICLLTSGRGRPSHNPSVNAIQPYLDAKIPCCQIAKRPRPP